MGLLLSPLSLTILGNSMGIVGAPFLIFILTALVFHLFTALAYGEIFLVFPSPEGETRFIKNSLGSISAIVLPLCSRVLFTLCAATAILATAGYSFNEVFLHWFPNLAFSFCLFGFLLLINVLGHRVSSAAQIFFVGIILLGLLILSLVGLLNLGKASPAIEAPNLDPLHMSRVLLFGLVLFVGFDLAIFTKGSNGHHPIKLIRSMILGILLAAIILALWGLVSINHVPPGKLADTTVPHMVAARVVMGQSGRFLMGLVVVAGSCAAVNALLMTISEMISAMAKQGLLPPFLTLQPKRVPIPLILLGMGIAAMMAAGMAGKRMLEIYTKAGIWFWIFNYATIHFSVLVMRHRYRKAFYPFQILGSPVIPIVGLLTLLVALVGLLVTDPEGALILKSVFIIFIIVSILGFLWIRVTQRRKPAGSPGNWE